MARLIIVAFGIGLATWAWWSAVADWRMGRAPAAATLTKVHYAKRSGDPVMFWGLTIVRFGICAGLTGAVSLALLQLLTTP